MNNVYVGYFSPNGASVQDRIRRVSQVYFSRPEETSLQSTGIGFGLMVESNSTDAVPFHLISTLNRAGLFILAEARLDNRDYLIKVLGEKELESPQAENALFIYHSFRKWGSRLVDHLDGDWSIVVFDSERKELLLAVDHLATRSVFYFKQGDEFVFSNSKRILLEAIGTRVILNDRFILRRLLISRISSPETSHEGVFTVPPGHVFRISKEMDLSKKRYWFFDRVKQIHFARESDYIEAFLAVYREAVQERILPGYRLGSHLSGGLDSGSVSVLAAEYLRSSGKRLLAFTGTTSVAPKESKYKFENEDYYAGLTAQFAGNIDQEICDGTSYTLLGSIAHSVDIFQELAHGIGNLHWIYEISDRARQMGVDLMLVGQQGNATVSWHGERAATWKSTVKDIGKKVYWDILQGSRSLASFRKIPRCFANDPSNTTINRDFLAGFSFKDIIREQYDELDDDLPSWIGKTHYDLMGLRNNQISVFWQALSQNKGLLHWDPTNDSALMEFCLGVPESFYRRGIRRHLIRESMRNLLPDEVAFNVKKGLQSADWRDRFIIEQTAFRELLAGIGPNHPVQKYLDLPSLQRKMDSFAETSGLLPGEIARAFGLVFLTERWG